MANRGITGNLLNELGEQIVTYFDCVSIATEQNGSTVVYYVTNAPQDVTVDGNLYVAFGNFLSVGVIEEDAQLEIPQMAIQISGIAPYETDAAPYDESFMQTMLKDTTKYIDQPVKRYRVYFDLNWADKGSVLLFQGRMSNASITYDIEGVSSVLLEASSHWIDFTRRNGRFTNQNSQQSRYPGDKGFEYSRLLFKDIKWQEPPA
jgi:hypothetical protein